jgi:hypothetical protein
MFAGYRSMDLVGHCSGQYPCPYQNSASQAQCSKSPNSMRPTPLRSVVFLLGLFSISSGLFPSLSLLLLPTLLLNLFLDFIFCLEITKRHTYPIL